MYDVRGRDAVRLRALAESEGWDVVSEPGHLKVIIEEEYDGAIAEAERQGVIPVRDQARA